jgi:hypothetical protein
MPFCISEVRHREFPDSGAVSSAFTSVGSTLDTVLDAFRGYICPISPVAGRGFHEDLARDLETYLERVLKGDGLRPTRNASDLTYSRALNRHADLALVHDPTRKRVLFEVVFRPNFEEELVGFQIGANEGSLAAAVMVVPIDRRAINEAHTTMAEYDSVTKVVEALKPSYPLLLIGLRGSHAA